MNENRSYFELVEKLLACPCLLSPSKREAVVSRLPGAVVNTIRYAKRESAKEEMTA